MQALKKEGLILSRFSLETSSKPEKMFKRKQKKYILSEGPKANLKETR